MDDEGIIRLFFARDEAAIQQTQKKYGPLCAKIAKNILTLPQDAEECVNDTWLAAWQQIPPQRPNSLGAFLGRIVRNLSVSRYRAGKAQKRDSGMEVLLSELEDCLPSPRTVEGELNRFALGELLSRWLDTLEQDDRTLFLRRYWYGQAVKDLAWERGRTPNQISQRLRKLRLELKTVLEAEGVEP